MAIYRYSTRHGLVVVSAHIWGPSGNASVRLAVDTGALYTAVSREVLPDVGLGRGEAVGAADITTASRRERPLVYRVQFAALGERRMDFRILGHSLPPEIRVHGLLGLDFLQDRLLTIDFRQRTIELV